MSRERGSEIKSSVGRFLVDEGAFFISLVLVWRGKSTERGISISHCSVTWQKVSLVSFHKRTESGRIFSPFFKLCWSLLPPAVSVLLPTPAILGAAAKLTAAG